MVESASSVAIAQRRRYLSPLRLVLAEVGYQVAVQPRPHWGVRAVTAAAGWSAR
jgi:hypothetical protein